MVSDYDLAVLAAAAEAPRVSWAFAGPTFHATMTQGKEGPIIACEGSESIGDWMEDFYVLGTDSLHHPELGLIHAGFDQTTDECFGEVFSAVAGKAVTLTGHSKGGAEAEMLAAKLAAKGVKIAGLTTFGTPRWVVGENKKVPLLIPATLGTSYRHFKDIVTEVPLRPMEHPASRTLVEIGTGTFRDRLNPAGMHHMVNYIGALK